VLASLWLSDLAVHLDALSLAMPGWRRRGALVGIDVVIFVMVVIADRVIPMFTRNATRAETIRGIPALAKISVGTLIVLTALDVVGADAQTAAIFSGFAGLVVASRTVYWGARYTLKSPLLWILHFGHAWIPVGLWLRVIAVLTHRVPQAAATHAFTVGAIGSLTLGMMSRVTLGHTGRTMVASRTMTVSFVFVAIAAAVRVATPIVAMAWYRGAIMTAGIFWTAAFCLFLLAHGAMWVTPRVDGKMG
jgi:uncharacterized protein involved in response to NO